MNERLPVGNCQNCLKEGSTECQAVVAYLALFDTLRAGDPADLQSAVLIGDEIVRLRSWAMVRECNNLFPIS